MLEEEVIETVDLQGHRAVPPVDEMGHFLNLVDDESRH